MKIFSMVLISLSVTLMGLTPALAESYFGGAELKALIHGKTVRLQGAGTIKYRSDYSYNYRDNTGSWDGTYRFRSRSVCAQFSNGNRCDSYIKDGNSIYLENQQGARYKVRSIR